MSALLWLDWAAEKWTLGAYTIDRQQFGIAGIGRALFGPLSSLQGAFCF